MSDDAENIEFKIGELVRMVGRDEVGEVVSLGDGGLFVRYKTDSATVTFYPMDLVQRVPPALGF